MQTISASDFISILGIVVGILVVVIGSYSLFVIGTLRKGINDEKEDRKEREKEKEEDFRDYKRDVAIAIQELIDCKNENNSRLDVVERDYAHLIKDHDKNHGSV